MKQKKNTQRKQNTIKQIGSSRRHFFLVDAVVCERVCVCVIVIIDNRSTDIHSFAKQSGKKKKCRKKTHAPQLDN